LVETFAGRVACAEVIIITPPPPPPVPAVPGALIEALTVLASQEIYLALRITTPPPAPEAPPAPPLRNKGVV
jgi:hypothetical protein